VNWAFSEALAKIKAWFNALSDCSEKPIGTSILKESDIN
jgi:hypothetical protein